MNVQIYATILEETINLFIFVRNKICIYTLLHTYVVFVEHSMYLHLYINAKSCETLHGGREIL